MKELTRGENALLTAAGQARVGLNWVSGYHIEGICCVVDGQGKVLSDEWFLYSNHTQSPNDEIKVIESTAYQSEFFVNLDEIPPTASRCIFAAVIEGGGSFSEVTGVRIEASSFTGHRLLYNVGSDFEGLALIFAELYRHTSGWKMRAVGQGFQGGLNHLAHNYGIVLPGDRLARHTPSTPAAPQPPPRPPKSRPLVPPPRSADDDTGSRRQRREPRRRGSGGCLVLLALLTTGGWFAAVYLYPVALPVDAVRISRGAVNGLQALIAQALSLDEPPLDDALTTAARDPTTSGANQPSQSYVAPTCALSREQIFARYHTLGENYLLIRSIVQRGNDTRVAMKQQMRELDFDCDGAFIDENRREIQRLEDMPIKGWLAETEKLNICADLLSDGIETQLSNETRPALLERLMRNADNARNLGSDLTNVARDLAYYRNKILRLSEAFANNIEACSL